jgi:hypothetical protein
MAKYATKECAKCGLRRPINRMTKKTGYQHSGFSFGVYNLAKGSKAKGGIRSYNKKRTYYVCSPKHACDDPGYYDRLERKRKEAIAEAKEVEENTRQNLANCDAIIKKISSEGEKIARSPLGTEKRKAAVSRASDLELDFIEKITAAEDALGTISSGDLPDRARKALKNLQSDFRRIETKKQVLIPALDLLSDTNQEKFDLLAGAGSAISDYMKSSVNWADSDVGIAKSLELLSDFDEQIDAVKNHSRIDDPIVEKLSENALRHATEVATVALNSGSDFTYEQVLSCARSCLQYEAEARQIAAARQRLLPKIHEYIQSEDKGNRKSAKAAAKTLVTLGRGSSPQAHVDMIGISGLDKRLKEVTEALTAEKKALFELAPVFKELRLIGLGSFIPSRVDEGFDSSRVPVSGPSVPETVSEISLPQAGTSQDESTNSDGQLLLSPSGLASHGIFSPRFLTKLSAKSIGWASIWLPFLLLASEIIFMQIIAGLLAIWLGLAARTRAKTAGVSGGLKTGAFGIGLGVLCLFAVVSAWLQ